MPRIMAMGQLGNGLHAADHHEDALSVRETELATLQRIDAPLTGAFKLTAQSNLATTYDCLGRKNDALRLRRDVYSGSLRIDGQEHPETLTMANNLASSLLALHRYAEAKSLLRNLIPVARRVHGDSFDITLMMRWNYASALLGEYLNGDDKDTLDDLREAVTKLEDLAPTARRVLGGLHPIVPVIEGGLKHARAVLREALETQPSGDS